MNLIDAVLTEPLGGAHRDPQKAARSVETWIGRKLRDLRRLKIETVLKRRYEKIRGFGTAFISTTGSRPPVAIKPRAQRVAPIVPKPRPVAERV